MTLSTALKIKEPTIKEPESTLTGEEPRASGPGGADRAEPERRFPPDHLRLKVLMTFENGEPHMTATEVGIAARGDRVQKTYRHLIEQTRERLESPEDPRAELLRYPPATWFKFVPPVEIPDANTAAVRDGFADALNPLYEFRGDSVRGFLTENPFLGGLLFEARTVIDEHFGSETKTALEVVADPEALGDRQLFVLIRTELPRKDARARLAELDRTWWFDALPASKGKMEIALD